VFQVFIHETSARDKEPGRQVAIIVHRPLGPPNDAFDKAVEACMGTLDVSSDAGSKRTQFRKMMKR
jgi:hypothetical protein